MVVLHIASLSADPFSGVSVVVPQHVAAQGRYADTALINITNEPVGGVRQLPFEKPFDPARLPAPYDRPDAVVFHEVYRPAYLRMGALLRKKGIPYIVVPHGELQKEAQQKKRLKKMAANLLLFGRFVSGACAVQCLSEWEKAETAFGRVKFVGTNGVTIPPLRKESFRPDGLRFLYIGRLEERVKGLDLMIDAVRREGALLRERHCTLSIYGPDYQGRYARVEELIRQAGVEDIVRLDHELTGAAKERELLDADVFIQTSRSEGMPLGILEAMSYGLPVLITEGTSLASLVAHSGAGWTAATEPAAIAGALRAAVVQADTLGERSVCARRLAESRFDWPAVAGAALEKYREVCTRGEHD